jgi:hypothetical protein
MEDIESQNSINKKILCGLNLFSFQCIKFFMCVILSLAAFAFGIYLLVHDEFKTVSISAFATGLITNTIAFWLESPKLKTEKKPT